MERLVRPAVFVFVCSCFWWSAGCADGGTTCVALGQVHCYDGRMYVVDSCMNLLEEREACPCGCNPDRSNCEACTCQPECGDRECGPDPVCGLICGVCALGTCSPEGVCTTVDQACDPFRHGTCLPGEKCRHTSAQEFECFPAGPLYTGEPCTPGEESDRCAPGLWCGRSDDAERDRCYRYCELGGPIEESTCNPEDSSCIYTIGITTDWGPVGLCSIACGPFREDCSDGFYCALFVDEYRALFECKPVPAAGVAQFGEPCNGSPLDCDTGLVCVNFDSGPACGRFCDRDHGCSGSSCLPLAMDGQELANGAGVCDECLPDCSGRECGPEPACGASCGTCAGGDVCTADGVCCTPECGGRECGSEPLCGSSCGSCFGADVCLADGTCCSPDCADRQCGADPLCGASCGTCTGNDTCTVDGQCVCEPDCSNRECGSDPVCSLACGTCDGGDLCQSGACCSPDCSGRECGPDPVCGTDCGSCAWGTYCDSGGQCEPCVPLHQFCSPGEQCCQQSGIDIECNSGICMQCGGLGTDCFTMECCEGLYCNPAHICHTRDCSELGMECDIDQDCCGSGFCDSDAGWTCQNCRPWNTACSYDDQCCTGLSCISGGCQ